MVEDSVDLEPGAHVTLDGGQAVYAIVARRLDAGSPSGVAFRLLPEAGGWVDAGRVACAKGFGEGDSHHPEEEFPDAEFPCGSPDCPACR
ncbi:MAG TPA: hypothetical protein VFH59_09400 [Frateuria sp.]|uniref:hypothetical protein n=1 Tax=Frateuria sp. TaxID=2211372 RepID=UPI002D7E422C|nr:hypothetical protein [Frateuria sp.]HET6805640.1 hypothetical protein [Frateuria sp.]